jgi:hypothetical protein
MGIARSLLLSVTALAVMPACSDSTGAAGSAAPSSVPSIGAPPASASSASPAPSSAPLPSASPEEKAVLDLLQGHWRIESSTGRVSKGSVFAAVIGKEVSIHSNVLFFPPESDGDTLQVRKTVRVVTPPPSATKGAHSIEIDHRGHYSRTDPVDADPAAVDAMSKGWSRLGLVRVEGATMTLSVTFPQDERPTNFEPGERREVVVLKRRH